MLLSLIRDYRKVEKPILNMVMAEFFIQLINSSFMAIQPLYMKQQGYSDGLTAGYISYRFLGVLLLALPLGLFIKKRKLKPLFYISAVASPALALMIIFSIKYNMSWLINISQFLWGASFTFMQIPALPFILRNAKKETHTEAITLSYSTWSFAGISGSIIIGILNWINPIVFNEEKILLLISLLGFISIWFVTRIKTEEKIPEFTTAQANATAKNIFDYDWKLILKALTPTIIIAVGAGLTIPFISLFFSNVHHMSTGNFAAINTAACILVAIGAMLVPRIKKHVGYKIAIPTTQSFAVIALVLLATTQLYSNLPFAIYIASFCFMLRQPLMNMAGPMTSEIVMNYTGAKNREMVSALTSAIWSGTWFLSAMIFKILRDRGYDYVYVFLITAALYAVGVFWYYLLILDYHRREKEGLIKER